MATTGSQQDHEAVDGGSSPEEIPLNLVLCQIEETLNLVHTEIRRIADHFDPPPPDKVGTPYIAERLGCTTVWIAEMVRSGEIPRSCVVEGTGNGKVWKFHRRRIDHWIQNR